MMDTAAHAFAGTFEERLIDTVDGLKIYARDYAPRAPVTGLPVVCLHGLTRNSKDFEIIAPRIAALGRRVIAPDMRGRGRSSYDPDPAHYVPAIYAQDVLTLLDKLDVKQAVFVGTSMGGVITMVIAALAPDRIAASALNDIGPKVNAAGLARIASYVGNAQAVASWEEAAAKVREVNGPMHPAHLDDAAYWTAFAHRTWRARDDGMIEADYDLSIALAFGDPDTAPPADMTALFAMLAHKPVLSIRGMESDLLSPETVDLMRTMRSDLVSVEVANTGHAPALDEPEAWDALLDFLAVVP
ncbi:MAG TPA: alpha/beta hydrolase [Caulobacterales bacterium]|nr:alpha/beta hydrolase [Caulobacterales bacterium]